MIWTLTKSNAKLSHTPTTWQEAEFERQTDTRAQVTCTIGWTKLPSRRTPLPSNTVRSLRNKCDDIGRRGEARRGRAGHGQTGKQRREGKGKDVGLWPSTEELGPAGKGEGAETGSFKC